MQVKNKKLKLDMEQETGSILGKEYIKAVYCHLAYFLQSTSWEILAGIKIARRNIDNLIYEDDTTLMAESEELKNLLIKVEEESKKLF